MKSQTSHTPSTGYKKLDSLIQQKDPTVYDNRRVWSWFLEDFDRYAIDFGLQLTPDDDPASWRQFDTPSDAAFFGYWIQRRDRMILNWAEGDLSLSHFKTAEAYDEALLRLCRCYRPVPALSAYDPDEGVWTDYYEDRAPLFYDASKLDSIEKDE